MKAILSGAALLAAAGLVSGLQCAEASRFGSYSLSTTTFVPGEIVSVDANFTCSFELGYDAQYVDYYLQPPNYNPDAPATDNADLPILLSRAQVSVSSAQPLYNSTFVVPHATFAYSNYTFMGYQTDQNGPGVYLYPVGTGFGTGVTIGTSA